MWTEHATPTPRHTFRGVQRLSTTPLKLQIKAQRKAYMDKQITGTKIVRLDRHRFTQWLLMQRATEVFRRNLLGQREEMAPLRLSIDIREDVDKQEMAIIGFYKSRQTKWSRPLRWTLEAVIHVLLGGNMDTATIQLEDIADLDIRQTTVLDHIEWPLVLSSDDEEEYSVAIKIQVAEYLRQFIENASPKQLRQLVTFWVGWDVPMKGMQMHVVKGDFPRSSTCFLTLRLPGHHESYLDFAAQLEQCIATNETGFGLI
ncbi:hypothetical protein NQZ68_021762 [Dissostichus eleginoides]|nr:hypothetical protein NQZ68_021762 [Dissostichus eleginoides]